MDEVQTAFVAATSPLSDAGPVLDVNGFWSFIHKAPARAPQAPPVVHVLMHYPTDLEQGLAGAVILVGVLACPDLQLLRNS